MNCGPGVSVSSHFLLSGLSSFMMLSLSLFFLTTGDVVSFLSSGEGVFYLILLGPDVLWCPKPAAGGGGARMGNWVTYANMERLFI